MTPEETIAAHLARRVGSLIPGRRHRIRFELPVYDGVQWMPGPHPIGWLEPIQGGLRIRLIPTRATTTARALLEDELLDVSLSPDYPPVVLLTVLPTSAAALVEG